MTAMVSIDLGAQSGRVALGRYDGETLSVTELHRFPNVAVRAAGTLHWDALRLHEGLLEGLRLAAREAGGSIDSVAVDTWGIDSSLGATERYLEEAQIKHALADNAAEVILAVDVSKLDAPELAQAVAWDEVSVLVTELPPKSVPREYRDVVEVV